jgi:hypothetical protein
MTKKKYDDADVLATIVGTEGPSIIYTTYILLKEKEMK